MNISLVSRDTGKTVWIGSIGALPVRIGRSLTADIVIDHAEVSSYHCILDRGRPGVCGDVAITIRDCDSTNGTFVNGVSVGFCEMANGHRIAIGDREYEVHLHSASASSSLPADRETEGVLLGGLGFVSGSGLDRTIVPESSAADTPALDPANTPILSTLITAARTRRNTCSSVLEALQYGRDSVDFTLPYTHLVDAPTAPADGVRYFGVTLTPNGDLGPEPIRVMNRAEREAVAMIYRICGNAWVAAVRRLRFVACVPASVSESMFARLLRKCRVFAITDPCGHPRRFESSITPMLSSMRDARWVAPLRLPTSEEHVQSTSKLLPRVTVFQWVHMSDIHFGHPDPAWRANKTRVLATIARDMEGLASRRDVTGRAFVTGDIAFAGKPEQYEDATRWLGLAAAALGQPLDRFRVVPGNHDVDRVAADSFATRSAHALIRADALELTRALCDTDGAKLLSEKMSAYRDFQDQLYSGPSGVNIQRVTPFDWYEDIEINGTSTQPPLRMRIIGLCSAWASDRHDGVSRTDRVFEPNLVVCDHQLNELLGAAHGRLLLLLLHHPFEWLHPDSRTLLESRLAPFTHVVFSGHVHKKNAVVSQSMLRGGGRSIRISAASVHGDGGVPIQDGYSIGAVAWNDSMRSWELGWSPRVVLHHSDHVTVDRRDVAVDDDGFIWTHMDISSVSSW